LIPITATAFVWSYPVAVSVDPAKANKIDFTDPDMAFLMVGGYVYFDKNRKVCGVNTIIPATQGLQFSKPKKWNQDFTHFLMKDGRFQSITIKALNDCGAWFFCWIRPDEPLRDSFGMEHKLCPNVGFAYLFHPKVYEASPDEFDRDCYFHVLSGEEYEAQVKKEIKLAENKKQKAKKSPAGDKPGQKSAAPIDSFQIVGMLDELNKLVGARDGLEKKRKEAEEKGEEIGGSGLKFADKPISTWTVEMVGIWLDTVEFHTYKPRFKQKCVDGETLLDLDEATIKTLVQDFHVKKMLRARDRLKMQQQASQAVRQAVEDQKDLGERIEELKSQIETARTCVLCIDQDKNTKLNCGHVCLCSGCAAKLKECPVCRVPISKRERVYIS